MTGVVVGLGGAVAVGLGVLGWVGSRLARPPVGNPSAVLAAGGPHADQPVLVCLGDSLTTGRLGADWVEGLRARLGDDVLVVNAGVGGQLTWDLRQRLDEVARCGPTALVLLVGSNDAVGSLGSPWASFYEKGRPQAPTETWFADQYDALLGELLPVVPRLACLTLPPLGEDPEGRAAAVVRRQNERIRAIAAARGADLLDLHPVVTAGDAAATGVPMMSGPTQFLTRAIASTIRHELLGQSWDTIGKRRGLRLSSDSIHPNDRTAAALVALVEPWARRALFGDPSCVLR